MQLPCFCESFETSPGMDAGLRHVSQDLLNFLHVYRVPFDFAVSERYCQALRSGPTQCRWARVVKTGDETLGNCFVFSEHFLQSQETKTSDAGGFSAGSGPVDQSLPEPPVTPDNSGQA